MVNQSQSLIPVPVDSPGYGTESLPCTVARAINQTTHNGSPEERWPQTFKEAFCRRFRCSPESYEMAVFWRAVFRHALPLAWWIYLISPDFFTEDLELIREVGPMTNPELFKSEVNYFYGRNQRHKNWIRTVLRVRISGARMLRLRRRLFQSTNPACLRRSG